MIRTLLFVAVAVVAAFALLAGDAQAGAPVQKAGGLKLAGARTCGPVLHARTCAPKTAAPKVAGARTCGPHLLAARTSAPKTAAPKTCGPTLGCRVRTCAPKAAAVKVAAPKTCGPARGCRIRTCAPKGEGPVQKAAAPAQKI